MIWFETSKTFLISDLKDSFSFIDKIMLSFFMPMQRFESSLFENQLTIFLDNGSIVYNNGHPKNCFLNLIFDFFDW